MALEDSREHQSVSLSSTSRRSEENFSTITRGALTEAGRGKSWTCPPFRVTSPPGWRPIRRVDSWMKKKHQERSCCEV